MSASQLSRSRRIAAALWLTVLVTVWITVDSDAVHTAVTFGGGLVVFLLALAEIRASKTENSKST